jgi:hypothetical protein
MLRGALVAFLLGCGARSELDVPLEPADASQARDALRDAAKDAGLDVVDEPIPFIAVCDVPDAGRPDHVCTVPIGMGTILAPPTCVNDYVVTSGEEGTLEYACDSTSNWAAVTFERQTFPGSIHGNFIDVCIGTTYPWHDGAACGWGKSIWSTSQRIFGDYTTGALTYTYADAMISGHSCWVPCYAHADVNVQ